MNAVSGLHLHYDLIILGTGGVGSAAAFHGARRGARVLGLDRFPGGHDRGSSHGETRIIRQAYFEHTDYVPLLIEAYRLWAELEQIAGEKLLHQVGLLQVGPPDGVVVPGVLQAARQHGLDVETLSAAEVMRRYPGFRASADQWGVFEPAAGYLRVERCVLAHLAAAAQYGAELRHGVAFQSWTANEKGVRVVTDQGVYTSDKLIVTAGPWAPRLLGELGQNLRVLRKHLYWFSPSQPSARHYQQEHCPTFLYEIPGGVFYGFPQIDALGVKAAEHSGGETVADPLTDPRVGDARDLGRVRAFLRDWLPGVSGEVMRQSVCYYTMSPDEHFIVDLHPQFPRVAFAAGLSGHGFKFASVLGAALADLALTGRTNLPISFLGCSRFSPTRRS